MTNEEALNVLKDSYKSACDGYTTYLANGGKNDENQEDWIDALGTAISALESQRWIPVTERLPEKDDRVLVYIPEIGGANCSVQISKGWSMKYVSHWMPLPSTEGLNDSKL